ncbi:MAG: DUF488 domain-containing protein [Rhizobacter sp.]|nr:DUF488 domain-containing protein [Bacteriovorax sp.]
MRRKIIFTIGHSTHSIKDFIEMLDENQIEHLVDVRHYPGSKYCPQFGKVNLKNSLKKVGINYTHLEILGGRRRPTESDLNSGWRSPQFRGYADYMLTKEFKEGLSQLIELAKKEKTVIMCAEAVPWRCHRSLISDALFIQGFEVMDIFNSTIVKAHNLTTFAKVYRKKITYPEIHG